LTALGKLCYKHANDEAATLIVYIDDIVMTKTDTEDFVCVKHHLAHEFEVKGLGYMKYFLGIEVSKKVFF
jgi:hypothetical protein